jgi:hypothetical protein
MKKFFIIFCFFSIFFAFKIVSAQNLPKIKNPLDDLNVSLPNVQINPPECTFDEKGNPQYCTFSWIGDYIIALYNYLIILAVIAAIIAISFGGIIWVTSFGNPSKIGEAKAWIISGVSGMIIVFGSYLILNTINPNLLIMKPIGITIAQPIDIELMVYGSESEFGIQNSTPISTSNPVSPTPTPISPQPTGCADPNRLVDIRNITKCTNADCRLLPETAEGLKRAAQEAKKQGLTLVVTSAYRSLQKQQSLWAGALKKYGSEATARKWVAKPSCGAPHMQGVAIDACIAEIDCNKKSNNHTKLQEIMKKAGWIRYCAEWWHFQYNKPPKVPCSP